VATVEFVQPIRDEKKIDAMKECCSLFQLAAIISL